MKASFLYLDKFGKAFVPKKLRPNLRKYFLKTGFDEIQYTSFGILFWLSAAITYGFYFFFIYPKIQALNPLLFFIWTFFTWFIMQALIASFLGVLLYLHLEIMIYKRTKILEEKLADYLNLVSVSLKGGMSFENSLWRAIRPEFDVLAKEITIVSKQVMTGNDVKFALKEFADKYDSPILKRSVDLLISEIEGGGKIVHVIDSLVEDLRKTAALKRELRVSSTTYTIFITAIVIVIAPALFAVSHQLLVMVTGFTQNLTGNLQNVNVPINFGSSSVSPDSFKNFSYLSLGIIAIFSSMIVSIIQKGDIRGGLKYIPLFLLGSWFFYYLFITVMGFVFSGLTAL